MSIENFSISYGALKSKSGKSTFGTIIRTGFDNFDKKFGGLTTGEFVVLGGRPSMGKTQLLLSLCKNLTESIPVLYFTFDHSVPELISRFMSSLSNIPIDQILQDNLSGQERERIAYHGKHTSEYKLFITDQGCSINEFKE